MRSCITEFLDHRMEEIAQSLRSSNAAYSLAVEKSQFLFESIEPIMCNKKDICISAGDCTNFREYFQLEMEAAAIMQRELYRQGYLDCVSLLVKLGLLTSREAPL